MSQISGVNERWLPAPPFGKRVCCYLVVLTRGVVGDYAAYAGIVMHLGCEKISDTDIDFVARSGDKISEEEARCHFLLPEDINYRM